MSKIKFITYLCIMVLAIVTLFGCTKVLAQDPKIAEHVLATDAVLKFSGPDKKEHVARIKRNVLDPADWVIFVDGKRLTEAKDLKSFSFCEKNKDGQVIIGGEPHSCHVTQTVSDGAFLIGNHFCPYFLNPPGIWLNLCPWSH